MLSLSMVGIDPVTYLHLIEHFPSDLLPEFFIKYISSKKEKALSDQLLQAELTYIATMPKTKEGSRAYLKWRRMHMSRIEDERENRKIHKLNVFQRLRKKSRVATSIFNRLKVTK